MYQFFFPRGHCGPRTLAWFQTPLRRMGEQIYALYLETGTALTNHVRVNSKRLELELEIIICIYFEILKSQIPRCKNASLP